MIDIFLIKQPLLIIITAIGFMLAFWVLAINRKAKTNLLFFAMTILVVLWVVFGFLANSSDQYSNALFWFKLNFGVVSLATFFAYLFTLHFPYKEKKYSILDKVICFVWITLSFLSIFTNFIIKNLEFKDWGIEVVFGKGGNVFLIASAVTLVLIIFNLFKKYFNLHHKDKLKIQYLLIGLLLFAALNFTFNILFPIIFGTSKYYYLGDYSAIFLLGFIAYAIIKKELFDIRVVLTALFVGLIGISLILDIMFFTEDFLIKVSKSFILILFFSFGYSLIKSVFLEIKRREEMEKLTYELEASNLKLTLAYKKLEKLDKAKSEFISIASHQLRTPLTVIKGYISMILEDSYGKIKESVKKPMESVYQSNERLIRLVNDLLNLSRLDAGKIKFEPSPISIESIVESVVSELKTTIEANGLYVEIKKSAVPLPEIMVDQNHVRQVILNIIDNAAKYTRKGGITIELSKMNEMAQVKISDTGEGMDESELESLFQMFSRATAGVQFHTEGAGIGLHVAKKFIEMHNGKIWAESEGKGKGSSFIIQIPINFDPKLLENNNQDDAKNINHRG